VKRGETNKGGARVTPQQVERWVSETARKEWDTIPAKERKGMNYQQHLDKVRERFTGTNGGAASTRTRRTRSRRSTGRALEGGARALREALGQEADRRGEGPDRRGLGAGENALDEED
jgi:hypothetical protein